MSPRRLLLGLAVAALALAAAPHAGAISRAAAEGVALRVLAPQGIAGDVVLFGLPKPLAADAIVNEYGTGARLSGPRSGKAWLFWLDLEPGASFEHASRVLLVSDRTGKVVANRGLRTFPLVDGRPPAFLASEAAFWGARFHVFSNVPVTAPRVVHPAVPPLAPAGIPAGIPPEAMVGECILLVVHTPPTASQRGQAQQAIDGWTEFAGSLGVPIFLATKAGPVEANLPGVGPPSFEGQTGGATFGKNLTVLIDEERCRDIVIYVIGHGYAPPDLVDDSGQPVPGGEAGIDLGTEELTDAERARGKRPRGQRLRAEFVEDVVQALAGKATFKFVLESCYAERFKPFLADEPNVKIVTAAAGERETARGWIIFRDDLPKADVQNPGRPEFTHGLLTGIEATLANPAEVDALAGLGDSLMARLLKAGFDKEDANDRAARGGLTHPVEMNNLAQPYGFGPTSHQHREGATTIICGTVTGPPGATVQVRLRHVPTGNTATGPPRQIGSGGRLGWGFTLSEHGGFSVEVLVNGVPLATTRYAVPDPPVQGPFACAPG